MLRLAVLAAFVAIAAACGVPPSDDPFADVVVEANDKEDSPGRPTHRGALPFDTFAADAFTPLTSGYHLYRLRARAGWSVRVTVRSQEFKTYVRITSPSGATWADAAEVRDVENGAYHAILDVFDLPEDGEYAVLASSVANMGLFPFAKSWGDYEIGAETDVECPLDGADADCPETLACIHDARDRDGFGTCLRD
jgi:hypothetical protein